jgi:hypothetical protein
MANAKLGEFSLERMVRAVELVRERMLRAAAALERANIRYAVIGGNAVATWVSKVDPGAARNTVDVDIVIRRGDLPGAKAALGGAGFVWRHSAGIDMFLDGAGGGARDAVHVLFAGEKVRPEHPFPAADVDQSEPAGGYRVISLEPLVRMKLTSYRRKDQVHLQDMMDVGLLDESWCQRLPQPLADRLKLLIDTPDG